MNMRDFLGILQDYSAGGAFLRFQRWATDSQKRTSPAGAKEIAGQGAGVLSSLAGLVLFLVHFTHQ